MAFNLNLLRAIAILLVTNSHFDALYPDPRMGTGGALGNAIVFALSGYGLAFSYGNVKRGFLAWYWRRITRIFPSVWIVAIVTMTAYGLWGTATPASLMAEFVWPTRHWFVGAISLFYVAFFFILASGRPRYFERLAALLVVPYAVCYLWFIDLNRWSLEGGYFGWIFYAQVMLLGGALATRSALMVTSRWRREAMLLAALFLAYFACKLAISATGFWRVQCILHVLTLPVVLLACRVTAAPAIQRWTETTRLGRVATFISLISFEIYVTQHLFHSNAWLKSLPFPLGAALALAGILAMATMVMRLADLVRTAVRRLVAVAVPSTARTPT